MAQVTRRLKVLLNKFLYDLVQLAFRRVQSLVLMRLKVPIFQLFHQSYSRLFHLNVTSFLSLVKQKICILIQYLIKLLDQLLHHLHVALQVTHCNQVGVLQRVQLCNFCLLVYAHIEQLLTVDLQPDRCILEEGPDVGWHSLSLRREKLSYCLDEQGCKSGIFTEYFTIERFNRG